jgi:signal transduction histidine kinase/CHASE2 domain-containing sensor protein
LRLGLWLAVATAAASLSFPVTTLSQRLGDFYFRVRSPQPTSQNVALVLIDDQALAHYGRWPWHRRQVARLVHAVNQSHPKGIGIDILLSEPEDEADDSALTSAIEEAHNVVLPAKISSSLEGSLWQDPMPRFIRAAAAIGHVQAVLDSDGACRRIPIAEPSAEGPRFAFAVEVARLGNPDILRRDQDLGNRSPNQTGGIARFDQRFLTINYRQQFAIKQPLIPFVTISANDLLEGGKEDALEGKLVLIGFGATELSDRLFTPVSQQDPMPGVEVNANAVETLLNGNQLEEAGPVPQVLLLMSIGICSLWIVLHLPGVRGLLALLGVIAAGYFAGYLLFAHNHRLLHYGPFLLAAVLAAPLAQLENLIVVDRTIGRRLKELEQFLSRPGGLTPNRISVPVRERAPSQLHWRLKSLQHLQDELGLLYVFDETLLETMQEALAVYAVDGRAIFHNSSWKRFCERQALGSTSSWEMLIQELEISREFSLASLQLGAWVEKEITLKSGSWRFRGIRLAWTSPGLSNVIMLLAEDISPRRERDQARSEALGFVTHELRTPLVAIQGFAELLMRYPQQPASSEAPATIFRESRRLVAMINSYLEVLRMDVGSRPLRRKPAEIGPMVNHVLQILQPLAQAAHIDIQAKVSPDARFLDCDETLVMGALLNLVSNAVKYSPSGSSIQVEVNLATEAVEFLVRNPGPAIPSGELERVFEPYYRASSQVDTKPGWGLGLAFVKRISEQHGGRVEASSSPSRGTCFSFIVPVKVTMESEAVV